MPTFDGWKQRLNAEFHDKPRELAYLADAFGALAHGLDGLARLGKVFHLEPGPADTDQMSDWPKVLFHISAAPNGRLVQSRWHAADLGPGWFESYAEAQHSGGVDTQFAGRGGVFKTTMPVALPEPSRDVTDPALAPEARKAEFLKRLVPRTSPDE